MKNELKDDTMTMVDYLVPLGNSIYFKIYFFSHKVGLELVFLAWENFGLVLGLVMLIFVSVSICICNKII